MYVCSSISATENHIHDHDIEMLITLLEIVFVDINACMYILYVYVCTHIVTSISLAWTVC